MSFRALPLPLPVALAAALAAVLGLTLLTAPPAGAQCGSQKVFKPRKNANFGKAPIAIGDSPMLLALPDLADRGFLANARGCRQFSEGVKVLKKYKKKGRLGRLAVIALGSNASIAKTEIHKALKIIGKQRILVLVTPRELGGGSGGDAALVRKEAKKHRRIRLLDWVKHSAGHGSWFQPDGLHLTFKGADKLADFFADLVFRILKSPKK